ncbi:MAG: hypothetical protein VW405_07315, partial [Rhodospirillaceae bacterium]
AELSAPAFGRWLRELRGLCSRHDVAMALQPRLAVPMKLSSSHFQKYEAGTIPPWPVLAALSAHYGIPMPNITARLVAAIVTREGRDLGCHAPAVPSDDAGHTVLSEENARLRAELGTVIDIAGELIAVAVAARKTGQAGGAVGAARPRGRRGRRSDTRKPVA